MHRKSTFLQLQPAVPRVCVCVLHNELIATECVGSFELKVFYVCA